MVKVCTYSKQLMILKFCRLFQPNYTLTYVNIYDPLTLRSHDLPSPLPSLSDDAEWAYAATTQNEQGYEEYGTDHYKDESSNTENISGDCSFLLLSSGIFYLNLNVRVRTSLKSNHLHIWCHSRNSIACIQIRNNNIHPSCRSYVGT